MAHVLMLGWEYPPFISGGLGTACEGLSKALSRLGTQITFVIPKLQGAEEAGHMNLVDPEQLMGSVSGTAAAVGAGAEIAGISTIGLPAFLKPYWGEEEYQQAIEQAGLEAELALGDKFPGVAGLVSSGAGKGGSHYGSSLFEEVARYAALVLSSAGTIDFDVIHAHDWMTFPAGVALAQKTGKPLVVHVHSLEYDRSGVNGGNPTINEFERLGTSEADSVIAVSHYTKSIIASQHGIDPEKISVSHNGIYPSEAVEHYQMNKPDNEKWVLFLGRVTFQKGPDYFIEAAAKVIPHVPEAKFILAGSGDMLPKLQDRVAELGIEENVVFPGFLRGKAVEEAFLNADLYVMPSVSEPFGISALEALNFETPALISKQSGVSEVIGHALKFDFWDVDRLADLTINALQFGELREDMLENGKKELQKLRWDASAERVQKVYEALV